MNETWKQIGESKYYLASNTGLIYSIRSDKVLSQINAKDGHLYIFIHRKKRWVHRIVLEAFSGKCPEGMECRHLDGNPANNHINNLAWGTKKENSDDRYRHGTYQKPEEIWSRKLNPASDVPAIFKLHDLKFSSRKIGKLFNVSHTTIQEILRHERWKGYCNG